MVATIRRKAGHKIWEERIQARNPETLSKLQHVCVNLKSDLFLINDQPWAPWNFGYLERKFLSRMALILGGWLVQSAASDLCMQFMHLRHLELLDSGTSQKEKSPKVKTVKKGLMRAQKLSRMGTARKYVAPTVRWSPASFGR